MPAAARAASPLVRSEYLASNNHPLTPISGRIEEALNLALPRCSRPGSIVHGGTITVDSRVGDFTEFTIRLPRAYRAAIAEAAS
jgi:hypothetical protein